MCRSGAQRIMGPGVHSRLLSLESFYRTGGELSVFSVSRSKDLPVRTCLSVLKSIVQIFNMIGGGVGGVRRGS